MFDVVFFNVTLKKTPQRVRPWKNLEGALKHDELVYYPFNFSDNHHTHTHCFIAGRSTKDAFLVIFRPIMIRLDVQPVNHTYPGQGVLMGTLFWTMISSDDCFMNGFLEVPIMYNSLLESEWSGCTIKHLGSPWLFAFPGAAESPGWKRVANHDNK